MDETPLITIFLAAIFTSNVALTYLLGMCPFVSLARSLKTAFGMGTLSYKNER